MTEVEAAGGRLGFEIFPFLGLFLITAGAPADGLFFRNLQ